MNLPPLRQSSVETAACPRAYVEIHINGHIQPDSIPSERGTDIHHVMSEYVRHCTQHKIIADWPTFNYLSAKSGPEAGPILDGIRDLYQCDWAHVYGTEVTLALDEDFCPTDCGDNYESQRFLLDPGMNYSGLPAAYIGTLDVILLSDDGKRAKIDDYKSHPAPFDADTFQGTLYPFMLFKHLPELEVITFELNFVRYRNCVRSVQWKREEMPAMQAAISRARERQRITHENPDEAQALPCKVCVYCPLAAKIVDCPVSEWGERGLTAEQRLMFKVWLGQMGKIHTPKLKEWAEVHGTVRYRDANGKVYEYGEMEVPSTRYPLDSSMLKVLEDWKVTTGEDLLDGRLNVSSTKLKGLAKAKKRADLLAMLQDSCIETATKPKYAIRTPEGIEEEYNPYGEE